MLRRSLISAMTLLCLPNGWAKDKTDAKDVVLDEVVVTAPRVEEPLTVTNNPKAPQQPVPANDGGSFLKNIPGFNLVRKGGTDGDPVFRGLAGSRLNILIDGAEILGGCGQRMDPPTAYVFPEQYDKVTVLKGPQTVRYGNGNLAGVVLFERDIRSIAKAGTKAQGSLMGGAWGRLDGMASGSFGAEQGFMQATVSHAESDDYKDGGGRTVHSKYERQSVSGMAGWTPDADTSVVLDAIGSRAEAAYADRGVDGNKFDRQGVGLKAERTDLSPLVKKLSGQVYYNYIDHVMDNYSMRPLSDLAQASVYNPDRETEGARLAMDLGLSATTLLTIGLDWQTNKHTLRTGTGYEARPRPRDMESNIWGIYGEMRHNLTDASRLIAGVRYDTWNVDRYSSGSSPADAQETLEASFLRYEQDLDEPPLTLYLGLGHAERPMDYWETVRYNGLTATSQLDPERNTQLDGGVLWDGEGFSASASLFYSQIDDFILIGPALSSRNINASRWGGELDGAWRLIPDWTLRGSLAYVYGENDSMEVPLAQTPPLEGRLGLDYQTGPWSFAGMVRMVSEQDRVHLGFGNIVGTDLGDTDGFTTLAVNASYRANKILLVSAGVDNLLDEDYAEHISRSGAVVSGYTPTTRVNEPGRFAWLKVSAEY